MFKKIDTRHFANTACSLIDIIFKTGQLLNKAIVYRIAFIFANLEDFAQHLSQLSEALNEYWVNWRLNYRLIDLHGRCSRLDC